jgi:hypothetical protein
VAGSCETGAEGLKEDILPSFGFQFVRSREQRNEKKKQRKLLS